MLADRLLVLRLLVVFFDCHLMGTFLGLYGLDAFLSLLSCRVPYVSLSPLELLLAGELGVCEDVLLDLPIARGHSRRA